MKRIFQFTLLIALVIPGWSQLFAQNNRGEETVIVIPEDRGEDQRSTTRIKANETTIIQVGDQKITIKKHDGETYVEIEEKNSQNPRTVRRDYDDDYNRNDDDDDYDDDDDDDDYDRYDDDDDDDDDKCNKKRKRSSKVDVLGFDIGLTNFYSDGNFGLDAVNNPNLELPDFQPGSHLAIHVLPTTVSLDGGHGYFNLKTALTLDYNKYNFVQNVNLLPHQDQVIFEEAGVDYTTNKLVTRYVQLPLLLNINTSPWTTDGLSMSFGVYGGVLWKANLKQNSEEFGEVNIEDNFNLNRVRYGLMARFDLKWLDVYATYNLSELFEDNRGPAAQTVTFGLNVLNF